MFDRVPSRDMSAVSLTRRRNCGAGQQIRILEENQSPAVNLRLSGCSLPFLRCCIFRKRPYQNIRFRLIRIRWSFLLRFLCILRLRQWQRFIHDHLDCMAAFRSRKDAFYSCELFCCFKYRGLFYGTRFHQPVIIQLGKGGAHSVIS